MIDWIQRKVINRYTKSATRYVLMLLVGALVGSDIPGVKEVAEFLTTHADTLVELVAAVITGLVATWSAVKNRANARQSDGSV